MQQETSQSLVEFFSEDTISSDSGEKCAKHSKHKSKKSPIVILTDQLQRVIWNQPPCANDKCIPGKLSLCIGMPVIIRSNSATELCITRGQEAIIHSWQHTVGTRGQKVLETLFVELQNPPKQVKFEGLPLNVVPLTRSSVQIKCSLPNDEFVSLSHSQIEVLPNFAMTDYSSQGKTRPYNPVDLNNCRTHQSYYTALSRSASAAGTCIVQGFDPRMVTGGASGALHQEFRELDLLDDIVCMRYEGKLPVTIVGDRRQTLIHSFRTWKGENYVPVHVHNAIRWGSRDTFPIEMVKHNGSESLHITLAESRDKKSIRPDINQPVTSESVVSTIKSKVVSVVNHEKRKFGEVDAPDSTATWQMKKTKSEDNNITQNDPRSCTMPSGTIWSNNSCAYDAVVTLLYSVWADPYAPMDGRFSGITNVFFTALLQRFNNHHNSCESLENARDNLRRELMAHAPNDFTWGAYVGIENVFHNILQTTHPMLCSIRRCPNGHRTPQRRQDVHNCVLTIVTNFTGSVQHWLSHLQVTLATKCSACKHELLRTYVFQEKPPIIILDVSSANAVQPDHLVYIRVQNEACQYKLRGIVYFGGGHYVTRVISSDNHVWYHDGIETGRSMRYDGSIENCNLDLCRGRSPVIYLYSLQ